MTSAMFKALIWDFYRQHGRSFAWRHVDDPYKVLVSEIMLQQTQTHRVVPKYEQFITEFATVQMLAQASLRDVLSVWQGLGYNRRAKFLHQLAQEVVTHHNGVIPSCPEILHTLPGIGKATAGSLCAFAYNMPTVFIETNIRAVYIHSFFGDQQAVSDKTLLPFIEQTVDHGNPREWYYALMDYGVMLKKTHPNPSRKSAHHKQQSKFEGSNRQIRGKIIRELTNHESMTLEDLALVVECSQDKLHSIVAQLCAEEFISCVQGRYCVRAVT